MAWAGGNFTRVYGTSGWTNDASSGTGIEPGRHDTQDNDLADGITACINKDGSNAMTGNLNLGSNKIVSLAAATNRTEAAQVAQVQDGDYIWLGTTGGTATAQTATAAPAIAAYKAGQKFRMKIGAGLGSTGAAQTAHTLNINSLGAKNFVNQDGTNPTAGTWIASAILEAVYDGTNFVIVNDPGSWQAWSPSLAINSGTISGVSVATARYRKDQSKVVTLTLKVSFSTTTGGANVQITGLPVNFAQSTAAYNAYTVPVNYGGTGSVGQAYNDSGTQISVIRDQASTPWGTGSNIILFVISYEGV